MITSYSVDSITNKLIIDFVATIDCSITFSILDGTKIVTEFIQNKPFKKGVHRVYWDKNNFLIQQVAAGNYKIGKLEHVIDIQPQKPVIGNTSANWLTNRFGDQKFGKDITIINGYMYIATGYNESGRPFSKVKLSNIGEFVDADNNDYIVDIERVCCSADRVYKLHYIQPTDNVHKSFVDAITATSDVDTPVVFPNSVHITGTGFFRGEFDAIAYQTVDTPYNNPYKFGDLYSVSDLSVTYDNLKLLRTHPTDNNVSVWNLTNNSSISNFTITKPWKICRQTDSLFWVLNSDNKITQLALNNAGTLSLTGKEITLTGADDLECSPDGTQVSISTLTTNQVISYSTNTLMVSDTIGMASDYSMSAVVTDDKLGLLVNSAAIAYDATGKWVIQFDNFQITHYNSSKVIDGTIGWLGDGYCLGVDRNTKNVFANYLMYTIDYTKNNDDIGYAKLTRNYRKLMSNYGDLYNAITWPMTINGKLYCISRNTSINGQEPYEFLEITDTTVTALFSIGVAMSIGSDGMSLHYAGSQNGEKKIGDTFNLFKRVLSIVNGNMVVGPQILKMSKLQTKETDAFITDEGYSAFGEKLGNGYIGLDNRQPTQRPGTGYHLAYYEEGDTDFRWQNWYNTTTNYQGNFPLDNMSDVSSGTTRPFARSVTLDDTYVICQQACEFHIANNRGNQVNMKKMFWTNGMFLCEFGTWATKGDDYPKGMSGNVFMIHSYFINTEKTKFLVWANMEGPFGSVDVWKGEIKHINYSETSITINTDAVVSNNLSTTIDLLKDMPIMNNNLIGKLPIGWSLSDTSVNSTVSYNSTLEYSSPSFLMEINQNPTQAYFADVVIPPIGNAKSWMLVFHAEILQFTDNLSYQIFDSSNNLILDIAGFVDTSGLYLGLKANGIEIFKQPLYANSSPFLYPNINYKDPQLILIYFDGIRLTVKYGNVKQQSILPNLGSNALDRAKLRLLVRGQGYSAKIGIAKELLSITNPVQPILGSRTIKELV